MAGPNPTRFTADLVVVGSGAAGMYTALCAADAGATVILLGGHRRDDRSSYWAQGGLAAAIDRSDSVSAHIADTLRAGRGLADPAAAQKLCEDAQLHLNRLVELEVPFDRDSAGELELSLEGGHSHRRVVHAGGGATGRWITQTLDSQISGNEKITSLEGAWVDQLLVDSNGRCVGLSTGDRQLEVRARAVVLATGGGAALWSRTTNPPGSYGSGLMLAQAAGAQLQDLEFTQFHPTAVRGIEGIESFLISEAVRGEGAKLYTAKGESFVDELQPRDVVSKAIYNELQASGESAVELDMTMVAPDLFPNLVQSLLAYGHDPTTTPIPVAPAAHYTMGGITVDDRAQTTVPGLFAVGECSASGVHGANRLASNSLTECFVSAAQAAIGALELPRVDRETPAVGRGNHWVPTYALRERMWRLAGVSRDATSLRQLVDDPCRLASFVGQSALLREESRGAHSRADFPDLCEELADLRIIVDSAGQVLAQPRYSPILR